MSQQNRAASSKKILRPWLTEPGGSSHQGEVYLADPWLQDPPGHKMFTLAGFVPGPRFSQEDACSLTALHFATRGQ